MLKNKLAATPEEAFAIGTDWVRYGIIVRADNPANVDMRAFTSNTGPSSPFLASRSVWRALLTP